MCKFQEAIPQIKKVSKTFGDFCVYTSTLYIISLGLSQVQDLYEMCDLNFPTRCQIREGAREFHALRAVIAARP